MREVQSSLFQEDPLPQSFYDREVVTVARELVGCVLVSHTGRHPIAGRIVETEAYRQDDPASHAYGGRRTRNAPMFGPPGHAYVYFIYGMYDCFNIVCGPVDRGEAVLVRALEPLSGLETIWRNRYGETKPLPAELSAASLASSFLRRSIRPDEQSNGSGPGKGPPAQVRNLTSGPGKLCRALGITRERVNGTSLTEGPVTVHRGGRQAEVVATRRIGISKAIEHEWRFLEAGNPFISRPAAK